MICALQKYSFYMGIIFTPATQSRDYLGGIGLGEMAFILFVLSTIRFIYKYPDRQMLFSCALFIIGIIFGALLNAFFSWSDIFVPSEIIAIMFSMVISLAAVSWIRYTGGAVEKLATGLACAAILQLVPILLFLFGVITPSWMVDDETSGLPFMTRYVGFSNNPNQLGILICAAPPILIAAYVSAVKTYKKLFYLMGVIGVGALAVLIKSNTVFFVYGFAISIYLALTFVNYGPDKKLNVTPLKFCSFIFIAIIAIGLLSYYVVESIDKTGDGSANGRFQRYSSALQGIYTSALMGVGPGGQSGEVLPFEGTEAHNFLLDVLLQGGIISFVGYILIVTLVGWHSIKLRSKLVLIVFISILVEQLAHYTARQPMNWLYLLFPLMMSLKLNYINNYQGRKV